MVYKMRSHQNGWEYMVKGSAKDTIHKTEGIAEDGIQKTKGVNRG